MSEPTAKNRLRSAALDETRHDKRVECDYAEYQQQVAHELYKGASSVPPVHCRSNDDCHAGNENQNYIQKIQQIEVNPHVRGE